VSFFGAYFGGGAGGDSTAPTVTIVSPTPGVAPGDAGGFPADAAAAALTPIVLEVTDADPGAALVVVTASYAGVDAEEVVYRAGAFRGNYVSSSWQVAITDGVRLSCLRTGGWPGAPTFHIHAIDGDGNEA
jgi:hypothetical protein